MTLDTGLWAPDYMGFVSVRARRSSFCTLPPPLMAENCHNDGPCGHLTPLQARPDVRDTASGALFFVDDVPVDRLGGLLALVPEAFLHERE